MAVGPSVGDVVVIGYTRGTTIARVTGEIVELNDGSHVTIEVVLDTSGTARFSAGDIVTFSMAHSVEYMVLTTDS